MRFTTLSLVLAALCAVAPCVAEEGAPAKEKDKKEHAAKPAKMNTVCPVTGQPVDAAIAPVEVTVAGKGGKEMKVKIAVATSDAADTISKADAALQGEYAKAAKMNSTVKDGKAVMPAKKDKKAEGEKKPEGDKAH